ncbi:MAG: PLDc N-terminal domain-containing protein [Hymenobacteraceae bacterium]|nr:PLDc N-terminal domain-containing protein [Hymenobacteraceae bacterium]MDX5397438.1 PLDc N-terminal domain-containing protein [Hymenobacteraceae bacterium]MDX5443500.1 PLDc N-terminal domain-containing protein [Hymenobacteraceae bacterium]MDX5513516.1 PLDc N-terminal domain-containing protein [Hymenobacteraceae bacterium]
MDYLIELGIPPRLVINGLMVLTLVLLIWSVGDLQKRSFSQKERFMWLLLIVLLPVIGAILYLIFGRKTPKSPKNKKA